ncbi:MAG: AAA family ATPase [Anaerolineae bacterium]|nr:AAA family ATPase [Anaerolineae bacterium]
MLAPLIATKLHLPDVHADLIPRPQLHQQLEAGLQTPLILVSAPPGFGKSMLVASWLHARSSPLQAAWLSLDESDNAPDLFWRYFIATLQTVHAEMGITAQAMLAATGALDLPTVLTALINELAALQNPLLLVLDDYHLIQSSAIHENLRFLLDHLPANAHLALLTREDPPLGLARRRARRQMVEIRAADLRFDQSEATNFLNNTHKLALAPKQIETLEQRTEGWITGLQMAALSLQGRDPAQFFASFTGDDRYITDYLIEEVLQRQSEPVREFLLQTSILERLSAPLCATVTGNLNARDLLDVLERANLFLIPLDNRREWYRYHHLFAELLRQRLRETFPKEKIAGLHRAASGWYEIERDIAAAIRHARQVPDEIRARHLIERYSGVFFQQGALPQLVEMAEYIPPGERENLPRVCAAAAWASLATNQYDVVDGWLKAIERHFSLPASAALTAPDLGLAIRAAMLEVLVIRLHLPAYPPSAAHLTALRKQLNALPPEQPCLFNISANLKPVIAYNQGLLAEIDGATALAASAFNETLTLSLERGNRFLYHLGRAHLASAQTALGQLHAARQTCVDGLAENAPLSASPYLSLLHACLGTLYYEWNDLAAAEQHFKAGLDLARLWNVWESRVPLMLGLARLLQRNGSFKVGLDLLEELRANSIESLALTIQAYTALLQFLNGNRAASVAWLATIPAESLLEPTPANEPAFLDVARLLIHLQRPAEAAALLEKLSILAHSGGRMHTFIQARAILVKALAGQGKTSVALNELLQILPLAAAEGYLSTFLDEGETLRLLFHEARSKIPPSELRTYVEEVLATFAPGEKLIVKGESGYGTPELSDREREILTLLAEGLSNQEIAERLVISITTVKTHVGNIFNKLGVTSRLQAVAHADGLGLLPRRQFPRS